MTPTRKSKPTPKATKAKAKPDPTDVPIPFPFFGAGEANYFEWAELHVRFSRDVKPVERGKIVKTVPPPIADAKWEGRHLCVSSNQGVGREIQAAYSKAAKKPTALTTTSRFKIPDGPKLSRFNADTERWLLEAHGIVPIAAAFRRRDWEAGGTTLSPWHFASLAHGAAVLKLIGAAENGSTASYMVNGIRAELDAAKKKKRA